MRNTINKFLILAAVFLIVTSASAQYYDPYYSSYNYYNSGYNNNPNNGVVTFQSGYGGYDGSYNYSYIAPVSVSNTPYNCNNGIYQNYNCNYGNSMPAYAYSSLVPTTYAATNANTNTSTINGYVTVTGASNGQSYGTTWFQYGTSQSSLNWSTTPANVYSSTNINAHLTNLNCGTTYYFRAVTNGLNSTQYGNVLAFTTLQCNYNYPQYTNYNYQTTWQPPRVSTICYKSVKKVKKKYR